jgi:hypothetical protein
MNRLLLIVLFFLASSPAADAAASAPVKIAAAGFVDGPMAVFFAVVLALSFGVRYMGG